MEASGRPRKWIAALGGLGLALSTVAWVAIAPPSEVHAGWLFKKKGHAGCGHPGCKPGHCVAPAGWAGEWYWMRSPDQELRVIMSHYNRFCIRCHGVNGRGVWDIPDVPDFTDPRWQASRSDAQIVNILMEGRGARHADVPRDAHAGGIVGDGPLPPQLRPRLRGRPPRRRPRRGPGIEQARGARGRRRDRGSAAAPRREPAVSSGALLR